MTHIHHFYSRRNLIAVATAMELAAGYGEMSAAIRFLISTYNSSHATLMSRVVLKRAGTTFVVTGNQSGTLYVSDLPVEKNVLSGIGASHFIEAFEEMRRLDVSAQYIRGSSTSLDLPDDSVDYIFTDPPFGDFIPYAEANSIAEAWLGDATDKLDEAIVSRSQGKTVASYGEMLRCFFSRG